MRGDVDTYVCLATAAARMRPRPGFQGALGAPLPADVILSWPRAWPAFLEHSAARQLPPAESRAAGAGGLVKLYVRRRSACVPPAVRCSRVCRHVTGSPSAFLRKSHPNVPSSWCRVSSVPHSHTQAHKRAEYLLLCCCHGIASGNAMWRFQSACRALSLACSNRVWQYAELRSSTGAGSASHCYMLAL